MSFSSQPMLPHQVAQAAQIACLLEVSALKPGNVNRHADFKDMYFEDFSLSAVAIGSAIESVATVSVGQAILQAVNDTQSLVNTNTNLGIVLLLVPLARAYYQTGQDLREKLRNVLGALTVEDARQAYAAIRIAQAGGLGQVEQQDVSQEPTLTLQQAMALARERDTIAREYCTGYTVTFEIGLPALMQARSSGASLPTAIVQSFITLLAQIPDTLIQRKRGIEVARRVSRQARQVLESGGMMTEEGRTALRWLDGKLRDTGHTLNPGTTADLTTATIFLALLEEGFGFLKWNTDGSVQDFRTDWGARGVSPLICNF
jgi:triphosphoribosyl-dephospho-CoA synthase